MSKMMMITLPETRVLALLRTACDGGVESIVSFYLFWSSQCFFF